MLSAITLADAARSPRHGDVPYELPGWVRGNTDLRTSRPRQPPYRVCETAPRTPWSRNRHRNGTPDRNRYPTVGERFCKAPEPGRLSCGRRRRCRRGTLCVSGRQCNDTGRPVPAHHGTALSDCRRNRLPRVSIRPPLTGPSMLETGLQATVRRWGGRIGCEPGRGGTGGGGWLSGSDRSFSPDGEEPRIGWPWCGEPTLVKGSLCLPSTSTLRAWHSNCQIAVPSGRRCAAG